MVFQSFNLFAHKTILQNVTLGPVKVRGKGKQEAEAHAMELLERVGIANQAEQDARAAVRWAAAARRDRPGARDGTEGDALRRADLGARPRDDLRGARRHARARRGGHHDGRGHPRDGLRPPRRPRVVFMDEGRIVEVAEPNTFFTDPQTDRAQDFLSKILGH
jgi:glutamate transport system ATP-binding protein